MPVNGENFMTREQHIRSRALHEAVKVVVAEVETEAPKHSAEELSKDFANYITTGEWK